MVIFLIAEVTSNSAHNYFGEQRNADRFILL